MHARLQARQAGRRAADSALAVVAELAQALASTADLQAALSLAITRIVEALAGEAGSVFLAEADGRTLTCRASAGPVDILGLRLPAEAGIIGRTFQSGLCQMVRDVRADPDFTGAIDAVTGMHTRSLLCTPLRTARGALGVLLVVNKRNGALFDQADRDTLRALAAPAALAVSHAALTVELIEQNRIRRELQLARRMQRSLLPRRRRQGFPVLAVNRPAREISGDFYDFFDLPDGRIGFAIGDVAGKGLDAAFLMVRCASLLRFTGREGMPPARWLARANDELSEGVVHGSFVCAAVGYIDPATQRAVFASAGFPPALLHDASGFTRFAADGPPLGILPGLPYDEHEVDLTAACLYLFSDGVIDARDAARQTLGADGVCALIERHRDLSPESRLRRILLDLRRLHLADDTTLMLIGAGQ